MIEVGKVAPAFTLADQEGGTHALRDYRGSPVVVYFYPKDDTSGCTKEACHFRDLMPRFEELGVPVFGISPDDSASHRRFADKYDLPFVLLADVPRPVRDDEDAKPVPPICAKYGVWQEKSMYGRKYMGVVRTTYLLDGAGRVARRWDRVKVPGHADAVLEAASRLD